MRLIFVFGNLLLAGFVFASSLLDDASHIIRKEIKQSSTSQRNIDKLDKETKHLLGEYRALHQKNKTLATYTAQLQVLISDQEKSLKVLQKSIKTHGNLKRQLMPVAYQMLHALKDFVHNDIPFQRESRIKAIDDALHLMTNAGVSDAMKFQLVLDLYEIERNYGYTVETWRGRLKPNDNRLVDFLRIGRNVLVYREINTDVLKFWDTSAKAWRALSGEYHSDVLRVMQVADDAVLSDLFIFPLLPPQPRSE